MYFRGVSDYFFSSADVKSYLPGSTVTFPSFVSVSSDLRVAGRFMYAAKDISKTTGVIFKVGHCHIRKGKGNSQTSISSKWSTAVRCISVGEWIHTGTRRVVLLHAGGGGVSLQSKHLI